MNFSANHKWSSGFKRWRVGELQKRYNRALDSGNAPLARRLEKAILKIILLDVAQGKKNKRLRKVVRGWH
jgi:hypothetical protein